MLVFFESTADSQHSEQGCLFFKVLFWMQLDSVHSFAVWCVWLIFFLILSQFSVV